MFVFLQNFVVYFDQFCLLTCYSTADCVDFICWLTKQFLIEIWKIRFFERESNIFWIGSDKLIWWERLEKHKVYLYLFSHNNFASTNCTLIILFSGTTTKKAAKEKEWHKLSQELRMLSRLLSDCKSLTLNVMIQFSQLNSHLL